MSLASVEGVIIALLLVVPGGVGVSIRDYARSPASKSAFDDLLHALAWSAGTLLFLEILTGLCGLILPVNWQLGTFLIDDLLAEDVAQRLRTEQDLWYRLLTFAFVAAVLPPGLRQLRRIKWVGRIIRAEDVSLYNDGFEALFQETIREAAKWDSRWEIPKSESPWIVVDTDDDRTYRGQIMWRSTPPEPSQLILIDVSDVTDPDDIVEIEGMLLLRGDVIRRLWVMRPDRPPPSGT